MFAGHGLLAFALAALAARRLGWSERAALRVAVVAGLFGLLPDVDVIYGVVGLLAGSGALGPEAFWAIGNQVHRGVTHSLVIGVATAAMVGLAARADAVSRGTGLVGGALLAVAVTATSGGLVGAVTAVFLAGALGLAALARHLAFPPRAIAAAALLGLAAHPFGDLFTGEPPAMLYPFDVAVVSERVVLSADPTLHLLGAFAIELATVWLALAALFRLTDRRLLAHVDRRAGVGAGYALAAFALPAPTLDVSYHFVFSVLAVGTVGVTPPSLRRVRTWRAGVTGLAAVSLAALTYGLVYLAA